MSARGRTRVGARRRWMAIRLLAGLVAAGLTGCGGPAFDDGHELRAAPGAAPTDKRAGTRMTQYEWRASNSGPRGCPMELIAGDFYHAGGSVYIPKAGVHGGWGKEVSLHVLSDDRQPLPDSMEVAFFSWLEDRLYHGRFALPKDRIEQLFREGYPSRESRSGRDTYRTLVAGVAPGGAVAVWASGQERQVEVFFGQATPSDADWHQVMGMPPSVDRRALVAATLADAAKRDSLVRPMMEQPPPAGRWAGYRTRYPWRPVFEGVGRPERLDRVEFVNGERDNLELAPDAAASGSAAARPVPRFILFQEQPSRRSYWLTFDPEEATAAFARAGAGGRPVELVVAAPAAGTSDLRLSVRGGGESIALQRVQQEVYGAR